MEVNGHFLLNSETKARTFEKHRKSLENPPTHSEKSAQNIFAEIH